MMTRTIFAARYDPTTVDQIRLDLYLLISDIYGSTKTREGG